jgi:endoglucanase
MSGDDAGGSYAINAELMDRVEEVVGWILDNGMYAIINIHQYMYKSRWLESFPGDSAECMRKYTRIWEQVSERFKDYSDYVMFESLNEEGAWNDVWYIWGDNRADMAAKARAYGLLNAINQKFTDVVRASGGNNGGRHLLIAGYATDIDRTVDDMFQMPADPQNRCAVSVHYYDPFSFTHSDGSSGFDGWANPPLMSWGTATEITQLNNAMNKLKTNFVDKGIPVIVGEYGFACSGLPRPIEEVTKYTLAVTRAVHERGMLPVLWDIQLNEDNGEEIYYYNRHTQTFADPALVAGIMEITGSSSSIGHRTAGIRGAASARPSVSVKGKTLTVNAPFDSKVGIRVVDMRGKTVAKFNAQGGSAISLKRIPAGSYIIEAKMIKDGARTTASIVLR